MGKPIISKGISIQKPAADMYELQQLRMRNKAVDKIGFSFSSKIEPMEWSYYQVHFYKCLLETSFLKRSFDHGSVDHLKSTKLENPSSVPLFSPCLRQEQKIVNLSDLEEISKIKKIK